MAKKKWIKSAVKPANKGKFTAKAEGAGKTVAEYASEKSGASGKLGEEARFAKTMEGMPKKKKNPLHSHERSQ